jgi:pathogenesis-related protein 1
MKPSRLVWLFFLISVAAVAQEVPKKTGSKISVSQAQEALDFHNKVRKDVGTKPLEWSAELAAYAQDWADQLAKRDCAFEHRPRTTGGKNYGENIYWGSASSYSPLDASKGWYSEIEKYKHEPLNSSNWYPTGHYTQMVWYNTKQVGIGVATCESGAVIIVANYDPPGNYMGQKAY